MVAVSAQVDDDDRDEDRRRSSASRLPWRFASESRATHCVAVANWMRWPARHARIPSAIAMWVLPVRGWSPEQVAHELRIFFTGWRWLCTESIYQAIYDPAVCLTRPARRRRRRRRLLGVQRRGRLTATTMMDQRPAAVEDRVQAGHWERDLIMALGGNPSAIRTLVERTTRFLVLWHMPEGSHTRVFFCDAHAPWQRGSNENMNGLLRDYFSKGTDLSVHGAEELSRMAIEVNERPRKTLGWSGPADLFQTALVSA